MKNEPTHVQSAPIGFENLSVAALVPSPPTEALPEENALPDATRHASSVCMNCPIHELNLCAGLRKEEIRLGRSLLDSSTHTAPAKRTICHPRETSEFVQVICHGWAATSIGLPDGRRQILSFLLPGDIASTASLFEPLPGRMVESITEVTYRKFDRGELLNIMLRHPELFKRLSRSWIEERALADQLAIDLGRRTADERIARQILSLAERLGRRGMVRDQSMAFPLRQRQIADATGLTPVHVNKVLGNFQRANFIKIEKRSLTIVNFEALKRIAECQ